MQDDTCSYSLTSHFWQVEQRVLTYLQPGLAGRGSQMELADGPRPQSFAILDQGEAHLPIALPNPGG